MKITPPTPHVNIGNQTEARQSESAASSLDAPPPETAALPPLKAAKARPAWASKGLLHDDTTIRTSAEDARSSEIGSYQELRDDNMCRPGLGTGPEMDAFLRNAYRHLAHRWVNDRSAAMDQIGTELYADMRRAELHAIEGAGYLAQQYGLQAAKELTLEQDQTGLRITNKHSAEYQRTELNEGFIPQCLKIYHSLGNEGHPPEQVRFVNSVNAANRLQEKLQQDSRLIHIEPDPITGVKRLSHGLVAVEFKTLADSLHAEKRLKLLGLRPSAYEVMKRAHLVPRLATVSNPRLRNDEALSDLIQVNEQMAAALTSLPDGHAMQATGRCAASLLMGLGKALAPKLATSEFKHDPVVANAMKALANVAKALPTLAGDSSRFFAGYAAMLEEMHLLLAATKPYNEDNFERAAKTMLEVRAGKSLKDLHIAKPKTYLFSSGMEAISMGMRTAKALNRTTRVMELATQSKLPDYFEALDLRTAGKPMDRKDVRMAPLNVNMPERHGDFDTRNNWNSQKLVQEAKAWLATRRARAGQPAVLLLDITIEKQGSDGTSDLANVLAELKEPINDGTLKILLCKSYQKYTTLCSAKVMAGAVTLIAKDDEKTQTAAQQLQEAEDDLGWMQNDESQLLTHFLTHAHGSELEMIGNAARNAAFVSKVCFSTPPDAVRSILINREEGLPFIATKAGLQLIGIREKNGIPIKPAHQLFTPQTSKRGSFAFLPTSTMLLNDRIRITVGQETCEELVEKFYGFAWVNQADPGTLTPEKVLKHACQIAANAVHAQNASLLSNATLLSDRLKIIGSVFAPHLPDAARMMTDVNAMRAAMTRSRNAATDGAFNASLDDLRLPFALNMVASLLKIAGIAFDPKNIADEDWRDLEILYDAAMDIGLPGVSPATRSQITLDWARLPVHALAEAVDDPARQDALNRLLRHVHLAPYREDKAKILASIPDAAFAALTQPQQRKLIDSLFVPLDAYSRIGFIKNLSDKGEMKKAGACFNRFDADLKDVMLEMLSPSHLSGKSLVGDVPVPMSEDEVANIHQQLLKMAPPLFGTLPEAT